MTAPKQLQPCGTRAAYKRHLARGEAACEPCRQATARVAREAWARRVAERERQEVHVALPPASFNPADLRIWMPPLLDDRYRRQVWERLLGSIEKDENGCWIWQRSRTRDGYGQISVKKRMSGAHMVAYLITNGSWSQGLQLDHLCRVRSCCNPEHLEPVTPRINTVRGLAPFLASLRGELPNCKWGHAFDEKNTYLYAARSGRKCRRCAANRMAGREMAA